MGNYGFNSSVFVIKVTTFGNETNTTFILLFHLLYNFTAMHKRKKYIYFLNDVIKKNFYTVI